MIFIVVIVVFILVGLVKIKADIYFNECQEIGLLVRILCFKFKLFPHDKKNKARLKNKHVQKVSDEKGNKSENVLKKDEKKASKKKRSFIDILNIVKICFDPLPKSLNFLRKGIKIKNLNVNWCVATDDAFETAVQYGRCCSCFYALLGALCAAFDVKIGKIRIYPDFKNENPSCIVSFRFQVSIGRLFIATLFYSIIIIIKLLSNNKKERAK